MGYTEDALTVEEQVALLTSKGMDADKQELFSCLNSVSYHRLSGYWHPYRVRRVDDDWYFRSGTKFTIIWDRYVFDRQFRLLVFDVIERVEVALRNDLILSLAVSQGAFGYLDATSFPNMRSKDASGKLQYSHDVFLSNVKKAVKGNSKTLIRP